MCCLLYQLPYWSMLNHYWVKTLTYHLLKEFQSCTSRILMLFHLTLLLFVLSTASVSAADSNEHYQVMGLGHTSCKAFVASDAEGKAFFYSWLAGYMTAYNRLKKDTYSILGQSKKLPNIEGWLQDYCHLNPAVDFSDAIHKLLIKLHYARIIRKPTK